MNKTLLLLAALLSSLVSSTIFFDSQNCGASEIQFKGEKTCNLLRDKWTTGSCRKYNTDNHYPPALWIGPGCIVDGKEFFDGGCKLYNACEDIHCETNCAKMTFCTWSNNKCSKPVPVTPAPSSLLPTQSPLSPTKSPSFTPPTLSPFTSSPSISPSEQMPTLSPSFSPTTHVPSSSPSFPVQTGIPTSFSPSQLPSTSPTLRPSSWPRSLPPSFPEVEISPTTTSEPPTLQPSYSGDERPQNTTNSHVQHDDDDDSSGAEGEIVICGKTCVSLTAAFTTLLALFLVYLSAALGCCCVAMESSQTKIHVPTTPAPPLPTTTNFEKPDNKHKTPPSFRRRAHGERTHKLEEQLEEKSLQNAQLREENLEMEAEVACLSKLILYI